MTSVMSPAGVALGQEFVSLNLPNPGRMIGLSGDFTPVLLKGVAIHPEDPLLFDFVVDQGNAGMTGQKLTDETTKLVKYFMAGLAVPEKDLWVNLSPVEKDRIMAEPLSHTDAGRDMLAQDYILKQLTASLMYPEKDLGRKFWDEVYRQVHARFGNMDVLPVDAFNKVWITPDEAEVYQQQGKAVITRAHLKVMLESDYVAAGVRASGRRDEAMPRLYTDDPHHAPSPIAQSALRAIIIPILEKEVNDGKNFALLRQIFHSLILAGWYKHALKESLISRIYTGTNKIDGIDIAEKNARQKVYARYLEAYRKGVYNYVKDEFDQVTHETLPRKYFAGGIVADKAMNPDYAENSFGVNFDHCQLRSYHLEKKEMSDHSMARFPDHISSAIFDLEWSMSLSETFIKNDKSIAYFFTTQAAIDLMLKDFEGVLKNEYAYSVGGIDVDEEVTQKIMPHVLQGDWQEYFNEVKILKNDHDLWRVFKAINKYIMDEMNGLENGNASKFSLHGESQRSVIPAFIEARTAIFDLWQEMFKTYLMTGVHGYQLRNDISSNPEIDRLRRQYSVVRNEVTENAEAILRRVKLPPDTLVKLEAAAGNGDVNVYLQQFSVTQLRALFDALARYKNHEDDLLKVKQYESWMQIILKMRSQRKTYNSDKTIFGYFPKEALGNRDQAESDQAKWKASLMKSSVFFLVSFTAVQLSNIIPDISPHTVITHIHAQWPFMRHRLRWIFMHWKYGKFRRNPGVDVQAPDDESKEAGAELVRLNKGGIDLGQGEYLRIVGTDAAGMPRFDPADILRMQKDLRGLMPIPLGMPRPVENFLN
ncbi:MAG: hypothetical protein WCI27_00665 [Candidatus Omnitrophota bacterium]